MAEIICLGEIDIKHLREEFEQISTSEIIITSERIEHIKERHPEDFDLFHEYGKECVENPDIIIKDRKHAETVFMIKK